MKELYLWIIGTFVLLVFLILLYFLIECDFQPIRFWKERTINKKKQRIIQVSHWYKALLKMNQEIHYYEDIMDNGKSLHCLSANSKARFDKLTTKDCLADFVAQYYLILEETLERVRRNVVIYDMYYRKAVRLRIEPTEAQLSEAKVKMEQYKRLEWEIIQEALLPIPHTYEVMCCVEYVSPQGRNHYRKTDVFTADDILDEIKRQKNERSYRSTEAWRRKAERSRVTPAVRYRIMQRDGFRCCVCGGSAKEGVSLEVDHIIPISKGGISDEANLQTLCRDCNRGKGADI